MSHRVAIVLGTLVPPKGKEHEYTWVGDKSGGVFVRVITKVYRVKYLGWDLNMPSHSYTALEAAMDDAWEIIRKGEVLCNTVKAIKRRGRSDEREVT